jgi:phage FluMu protein Com
MVKIPRCTGCGSTTGFVASTTMMRGSLEVKCEKCKKIVGTTADANKFTKI